MRLELLLAGIGLVAFAWLKKQSSEAQDRETRERGTYRPGSDAGSRDTPSGDGVRFNDVSGPAGGPARDAYTGEDLDAARAVYQCQGCRVWYHGDTLSSLQNDNSGRCVSCGSTQIVRDRVTEDSLRGDV